MMRSLKDYLIEAEDYINKPSTGDVFEIEIARDEMLISGFITECRDDGIVIDLDDDALTLLEGYGYISEGAVKREMEEIASKMSLDQFKERYGDAEWIEEFWKTVNGVDEDLTPDQEGTMTSPDLDEAEYRGRKVKLGKPMAGDVKKSKVYVRGPKGNVVKVNFGDPNMRIKKSNPARRKSFRARHNCDNPGPRWKARYWSCRAW